MVSAPNISGTSVRILVPFYQGPKESPRVDELERQVKELNEKLERERKGHMHKSLENYRNREVVVKGVVAQPDGTYVQNNKPVSYTHLDVYKRQNHNRQNRRGRRRCKLQNRI